MSQFKKEMTLTRVKDTEDLFQDFKVETCQKKVQFSKTSRKVYIFLS